MFSLTMFPVTLYCFYDYFFTEVGHTPENKVIFFMCALSFLYFLKKELKEWGQFKKWVDTL